MTRLIIAGTFGGFLGYTGLHVTDWRFWVALALFFAYAHVRTQEVKQ